MSPKKLLPAALGGLFIGVLSALPLVSLGNCCCLWIIAGGYLAAYVMQQDHPDPITTVDGAIVGFLAGIFGAFLFTIVVIPIDMLMGPLQTRFLRRLLSTSGEMPPGLREMLENIATAQSSFVLATLFRFVPMLLVGVVFAPIGGVLAALFSRRRPVRPEPPVPPIPPAPPDSWPPPSEG